MMALDEVLMVLGGLAVGVSIGLVGIGGVFLIPLLVLLGGLSMQTAIGTALLTFVAAGDVFQDRETGTTWTFLGRATAGPLAGRRLRPLTHVDAFWFAWAAFNPTTTLYEGR